MAMFPVWFGKSKNTETGMILPFHSNSSTLRLAFRTLLLFSKPATHWSMAGVRHGIT